MAPKQAQDKVMQSLWQRELMPCRQAPNRCPLLLRQDAGLGPSMIQPSECAKLTKRNGSEQGLAFWELTTQTSRQAGVVSVGSEQRDGALGEKSGLCRSVPSSPESPSLGEGHIRSGLPWAEKSLFFTN